MRRPISVLIAAVMASTAVSFVPASAIPLAPTATHNDRPAIQLARSRHWRHGGGHWGGHHGGGHWGGHHHGGGDFAIGAFGGLATGLILGSQLGYYGGNGYYGGGYGDGYYNGGYANGGYDDYDVACAHRYRSYDPYSNTFMGYDGYRHLCRL